MTGRRHYRIFLFAFFALLSSQSVEASPCAYFKANSPALYKIYCRNGDSGGSARPAGASSTFSSSFNISAASLPTDPTGYGIESIVSVVRSANPDAQTLISPNFALIKGFKKFGAGVSTSAANMFYSNDVYERSFGATEVRDLAPREPSAGHFSHLNLGTSVALWTPKDGPALTLGLSARYNRTTDTWGGGPALLLGGAQLTIGAGITREKVSRQFPRLNFYSGIASARLWLFELEYNYLKENARRGLTPIHILTLSANVDRVIVSGAIRRLNYLTYGERNQTHFALQVRVASALSIGALYNYIPGTVSLGTQIYF